VLTLDGVSTMRYADIAFIPVSGTVMLPEKVEITVREITFGVAPAPA
jgi:hypothetical protein